MGLLIFSSPALTVMASINWSLQECVPTTKARFVFLISLSTVLCCGNKDAQQLNHQLVGKVPSQTMEVQQALSYQPAPCLELGPPIPLPHMTHTSPVCLFATRYSKQSFSPHPFLTRDIFAPVLSCMLASACAPYVFLPSPLPTSSYIHSIALHTPLPLPAAFSLYTWPPSASSVLLSRAALPCHTAVPSWKTPWANH